MGWHQQTDSIYHPWNFYRLRKRRPRNMGGPFITTKLEVKLGGMNPVNLKRLGGGGTWVSRQYVGDLFPHIEPYKLAQAVKLGTLRTNAVWMSEDQMSWVNLQLLGEKIMLSVVPTSAATNLFVNVGEVVSDGMIFGLPGRGLLDGDPGGEYLNTVFGIIPTKQAIDDFNTAVDVYDKAIKQYRRDAGKIVRRRTKPFQLPEEVVTSTLSSTPTVANGRILSSLLVSGSVTSTQTTRINREVWYAGAFQYMIPRGLSAFEDQILDWQRVYHILPSPADLWQLLPFSWLADWFTNGGDSLRHLFLQSSEGATQVYGYAMCKTTVETTWTWSGSLLVDNVPKPHTLSAVVTKTIKQRCRVSPFGSLFTGVELTPRQLAILAALGVAK